MYESEEYLYNNHYDDNKKRGMPYKIPEVEGETMLKKSMLESYTVNH
jgi:hypothetical protein